MARCCLRGRFWRWILHERKVRNVNENGGTDDDSAPEDVPCARASIPGAKFRSTSDAQVLPWTQPEQLLAAGDVHSGSLLSLRVRRAAAGERGGPTNSERFGDLRFP